MRGERRPYKKVLIIAIRKHWKDGAQMIPFGPVRGQVPGRFKRAGQIVLVI